MADDTKNTTGTNGTGKANGKGTGKGEILKFARKKLGTFTSELLTRMTWMARAGLTHDDNRDLWTVFGYQRDLKSQDLFLKYRRQDIAKTVVEAPCDALWTRPPKINGDEAFVTAWNNIMRDNVGWSVFRRADIMLGYSRYAVILVGLDDGMPLDRPVNATRGNKIVYLQPYSELGVNIQTYVTDPSSPRFGQPEMYEVKINETEQSQTGRMVANAPHLNFRVHHSRVIHIADNVIEDSVFGIPRLEPIYNNLQDLLKTVGGSAETYWLTANRGMQVDVDKDLTLDPEDYEDLAAEIDEYYHNLRRVIRTRGVSVKELGSKVADPSQSVNTLLSIIAATSRIPQRLLMGSEAGQLASEQDRANWAERVNERRNYFGEPRVLLPAMARFKALGLLPDSGSFTFEWPEAFILGPLERAQTSAQKARSAANLLKCLMEKEDFITVPEARGIVGFGDETKILEDTYIEESGVPST
jgi:hypothetical protein